MGRRTFQSIGHPLGGRTNIVISSYKELKSVVLCASSYEHALCQIPPEETETFIIGGGRVYQDSLIHADRIYLTAVDGEFPSADTHFPNFDLSEWEIVSTRFHTINETHAYSFVVSIYNRKSKEH